MTDFYLNKRTGSDGGSGSIVNPWLTLAKVNAFPSFGGSDRIFLYGQDATDRWGETLTLPRSGLTVGIYGSGVPLISGGDLITTWATYSGTTWQSSVAIQPNQVWLNNVAIVKGSTKDTLTNQQWIWVAGVLYLRDDSGSPAVTGAVVESGARSQAIFGSGKTDIIIQDLIVTCGNDASFGIISGQGGANNWVIQNVTAQKAAARGIDLFGNSYQIVGGSCSNCNTNGLQLGGTTSTGAVVDGWEGYNNGQNSIGVTAGGATIRRSSMHGDGWNTALPAHAVYNTANANGIGGNGTLIEYCLMYDYATSGDTPLRISGSNITVRYNTMRDVYTGIGTGDYDVANQCVNNSFHHNLISNYTKTAIDCAGLKDSSVYQNTFAGIGGSAWGMYLHVGTPQNCSGITAKNNIFSGTALHWIVDPSQTTGFVSDYNLYESDAGNRFNWIGNPNTNFAGWKTQSGGDANSPTPASPLFVATA